jgi:hypothetical protein
MSPIIDMDIILTLLIQVVILARVAWSSRARKPVPQSDPFPF